MPEATTAAQASAAVVETPMVIMVETVERSRSMEERFRHMRCLIKLIHIYMVPGSAAENMAGQIRS